MGFANMSDDLTPKQRRAAAIVAALELLNADLVALQLPQIASPSDITIELMMDVEETMRAKIAQATDLAQWQSCVAFALGMQNHFNAVQVAQNQT